MLEDELKKIELPVTYERYGKTCFYDSYRKRLVIATAKEKVIQKVVKLLEEKIGVPKSMIEIETSLAEYNVDDKSKIDIIIKGYSEDDECFYPLVLIGCLGEGGNINDDFFAKYKGYADSLNSKFVAVTNGKEIKLDIYEDNKYKSINEAISYEEMLKKDNLGYDISACEFQLTSCHMSMDDLRNQDFLTEYNDEFGWFFGADSKPELRSFAINFTEALLNEVRKLPYHKSAAFEIIEDLGVRYLDNTNAAGGHYAKDYRSFLLIDRHGEPQIVSFTMSGTDPNFRKEGGRSFTSLVVAIDDFKRNHNSLQYNVDRFTDMESDGRLIFIHNGQMSVIKKELTLTQVAEHGVDISVSKDGIEIGSVDCNKLFYLDDPEVAKLVYNLIEYALLREELRRERQAEKKA